MDSTWKRIVWFSTLTFSRYGLRGEPREAENDRRGDEIACELKRTGCLDFSDAVGDGVVGMSTSVSNSCSFYHVEINKRWTENDRRTTTEDKMEGQQKING